MVPPDTLQLRDLDRALPQFHEQQTASRPLSRRSTPPPEGAEPNPSALQQLHRLNRSSPNFDNQLSDVLYGKEYVQCVPTLQGNDLAWLVDYLDEALDRLNPSGPASRKCLRELRSICGARVILPTSYTLSPHSLNVDSDPFASGGYGDTYHGILNGARICVKRVYIQDGPRETVKRFYQEAVMWKRSTHPNIVPFLGVTVAPPQLVSNRMSGRTLLQYVGKRPDSDRPRVLYDVAKGLHYLHSHNVIHGGIKGANILVDGSGRACITDFGEATVVKDEDFVEDNSDTFGYTPRWAAPEVLVGGAFSKEADIFSFAMVMIEVFTGAVMFSDKPILGAMSAVVQGERPPRPAHRAFTDNLWTLMQRCWDHDPSLRPQASEVLEILAMSVPRSFQQSYIR
ncbi:kinase-like protein [Thelephora ganbajun]|uniref:Kinase-like protein n=1 Tax=Thelephora ganbajun TaxID=370292 RepID=A0ACB6Z3H8_THEGA|nr:kinase-like protein [Thelephora ganbajun]